MPIYDFSCQDCGEKFEKIIKSDERNEVDCPKCRSENTARELSCFSTYTINGDNSASESPKRHNNRF